jgi:hypothetical protein
MVAVGIAAGSAAGVGTASLVLSYIEIASAFTLLAALTFVFFEFAKLARMRADKPVSIVLGLLRQRAALLVLPILLWPMMLAAYTTAKMAIPFLVGYGWDGFWAHADRLIFGQDAWILSIPLVEWAPVGLWEWVYSGAWGVLLFIWFAAVPFYASKRRVGIIYTATFASWLIGGWLIAYTTSAAGPVFAHLADPALADRFLPMREHLAGALTADGPIRQTQAALATVLKKHVAIPAAGISAMPSMHLAMTTIYVLAARRTWWIVPACVFWLIIFIGSAYFGYHYWLDGIVAAVVALLCWTAAEFLFVAMDRRNAAVILHPAAPESVAS